jgi:hypothetical protein
MSDRTEKMSAPSAGNDADIANASASAKRGTNAQPGADVNPQDGADSGEASESRPRGTTEDPDITL